MKSLGFVLLCAVSLAGCATQSPTGELAKQIAVRYAVNRVIEESSDPLHRRDRVMELAQVGLDFTSGEPVLVSALENVIRSQIDLRDLKPSERVLINDLITLGVAELQSRVGDGGWLTGEQLVSGRQFFSWVLTAAAVYELPQPEVAEEI